ncbi:DUF3365 domain-containing protein [Geobacter sp. DSM 9736]|uniref:c-type heme family protein n=1 Tax=Geobacter sp. DSM 9736 TaxID=1277350 RepID=UPI000B51257E|nr:DUF3365 domain-containing protein [Geobacter sp. DSM 9736]SNB47170.1 PAS domain S-box-containing protein [Geobacter sp. DSM 9736]
MRLLEKQPIARTLLYANAILFVIAAAAVFLTVQQVERRQALDEALQQGRLLLERNLAIHRYFADHLKPQVMHLLKQNPNEDFFDPTWMSSTFAVRSIDSLYQKISKSGYYYKECAINARSPSNEADAEERAFIESLNRDGSLMMTRGIRVFDGKPYFTIMHRGETMERNCLVCHNRPEQAPSGLVSRYGGTRSFGRHEGQVVSAISIRVPLASPLRHADRFALQLSLIILSILFTLFGINYLLVRRLVLRPLERLRTQAVLVSGDERHLGEEIPVPSGRELRETALAFNAMSASLCRSWNELESRVTQRTNELQSLNESLKLEAASHKKTAAALQEALEGVEAERAKNGAIISAIEDGLRIIDADYRIVFQNRPLQEIFGDAAGRHCYELYEHRTSRCVDCTLDETFNDGRIHHTHRTWNIDGRTVQIEGTVSPVRDAAGNIAGCLELLRDVTDRFQMIEELSLAKTAAESANKAKAAFLANMSHEIRTPMNGIIGFAELLAESGLNEKQLEYAEMISSSGSSLLAIINDILDLSKIDAGKVELEEAPFSTADLLIQLGKMFSVSQPSTTNVTIERSPSVPDWLLGDVTRIRQIAVNLIGNALKFTAEGSVTVKMDAVPLGEETILLSLQVTDTGVGIARENLDRIFEPFMQEDFSTTRRFGGTGLGLAVSRSLAEMMGGTISVTSTLGEGSSFICTVTCRIPTASRAGRVDAGQAESVACVPCHILVAEDNLINQKLVLEMLKRLGHTARVVQNGREALAALAAERFDLVLMDIQMPEMDGLTAARMFRERNPEVKVPMVALTAYAMAGDEERFLEAGMDGYLSKPLKFSQLQEVIIRFCGG